jgi:hypothetical protein
MIDINSFNSFLNKTSQIFFNNVPENIIIWGAGYCGQRTFNFLVNQGFEQNIFCFIDNNPKLQDTLLFNKKILSPNCLEKHVDATVIGCIIPWYEIYDTITKNRYCNPFFISIHNILLNNKQSYDKFNYNISDMIKLYKCEERKEGWWGFINIKNT